MFLMQGDREVAYFDMEDSIIEVIRPELLPYRLRDWLETSDYSSPAKAKASASYMTAFRDFLAGRTLSMSRENAKAILGSAGLPQALGTEERVRITLACQSLSMTDSYWTKDDYDRRRFQGVSLREHHLGDAAAEISLLGERISVERNILAPDISAQGMFAKTWLRNEGGAWLCKTDRMPDNICTRAELAASEMLDHANAPHVRYMSYIYRGTLTCMSRNLADDGISLVDGYDVAIWCRHTGTTFREWAERNFPAAFADMCVLDYLIANTDRHLGNVQFFVDNLSGRITGMAPLMDHNQSLIADITGRFDKGLIYEPTGTGMEDAAKEHAPRSRVCLDEGFFVVPRIIKEQAGTEYWELSRHRAEELGVHIQPLGECERARELDTAEDIER